MKTIDMAVMTRRLSDLIGGGLTLSRSLDVLGRQSESAALRTVVRSLQEDVETGESFSDALARRGTDFSPLFVGLVRAGESSGNLESSLDELASFLESEAEAGQRVRAALAYPVILLFLAFSVCLFLTVFVVPRFESLFQEMGGALPLPTRMLIGVANLFRGEGPLVLAAVIGAAAWALRKKKLTFGSAGRLLRGLPWIDHWLRAAALERWARTMTSLLKGGFAVSEALELARRVSGLALYDDELKIVTEKISEGEGLAQALASSRLFPPMVTEMVGAGEESGRLDETLARLTRACRRETELKLKVALSLLEPALVLIMGVVVGFVALAMLLPIFQMSGGLK